MTRSTARNLSGGRATTSGMRNRGLDASEVNRLKELGKENSRLKRLYAAPSLENVALKEVLAKISKARGATGVRGPSRARPQHVAS